VHVSGNLGQTVVTPSSHGYGAPAYYTPASHGSYYAPAAHYYPARYGYSDNHEQVHVSGNLGQTVVTPSSHGYGAPAYYAPASHGFYYSPAYYAPAAHYYPARYGYSNNHDQVHVSGNLGQTVVTPSSHGYGAPAYYTPASHGSYYAPAAHYYPARYGYSDNHEQVHVSGNMGQTVVTPSAHGYGAPAYYASASHGSYYAPAYYPARYGYSNNHDQVHVSGNLGQTVVTPSSYGYGAPAYYTPAAHYYPARYGYSDNHEQVHVSGNMGQTVVTPSSHSYGASAYYAPAHYAPAIPYYRRY